MHVDVSKFTSRMRQVFAGKWFALFSFSFSLHIRFSTSQINSRHINTSMQETNSTRASKHEKCAIRGSDNVINSNPWQTPCRIILKEQKPDSVMDSTVFN